MNIPDEKYIKYLDLVKEILSLNMKISLHEQSLMWCGPHQGKPGGDRDLETKEEKQNFLDWFKEKFPESYLETDNFENEYNFNMIQMRRKISYLTEKLYDKLWS